MKPSGIGGQAVIEGIMMRNKDKYSIAVRKPDHEIEVTVRECRLLTEKHKWMGYPIIRGVVSFVDSLITGISTINYSASFYDDPEEQKKTKADEIGKSLFKDKFESVLMAFTVILSVFMAVGLFMLLPYFVSRLVKNYVASKTLLNFIEGLVRVAIFILYLLVISLMKDIKRTFMYHGAEHKCINCIENGARLTTENVMNSSRYHKRCGTSFLFIVMFISIVFFIFIRVDNTALQVVIRLLLVPVIAGVSYEFIRWAGKNDNGFTSALSKPGMWLQRLTTREPDEEMVEVAIKAVEEVFDWKAFLKEYYAHSPNPEADMLASEAKLAMDGELIHKAKNTRKIDAKKVAHETAIAETIRAVEIKSVSNNDSLDNVKSDTDIADSQDSYTTDIKNDSSDVKNNTEMSGAMSDSYESEGNTNGSTGEENSSAGDKEDNAAVVDSGADKNKDTQNADEKLEPDAAKSTVGESDNVQNDNIDGNSVDNNADNSNKGLGENSDDEPEDDDELPEGFEIEDEYETVHKIDGTEDGEYAVTTESIPEADASDNMTVEEVEAGFEIEEPEDTEEKEEINADDVPLFKERDRH